MSWLGTRVRGIERGSVTIEDRHDFTVTTVHKLLDSQKTFHADLSMSSTFPTSVQNIQGLQSVVLEDDPSVSQFL